MIRLIKIRKYERGLLFRDRVFRRVLKPGRHWILDPLLRARVHKLSVRRVWIEDADLDVIVRSGALGNEAVILDLRDHERALVWVDGRFEGIYGSGLRALWSVFHAIRTEIVDARQGRFEHEELPAILASPTGERHLVTVEVGADQVALLLVEGRLEGTLQPGRYAFWKGVSRVEVRRVDRREQVLDISGQELMTADKVTLRLNALVTYRVADPEKAAMTVESASQALYREAQLALRSIVGARELDDFLTEREAVSDELEAAVKGRAGELGLELVHVGVRDVILPGEMKVILNRVTEARKAAEADLLTRREETAAMRSQANTAKIFESNPALMRLRELEVLEKVAGKANLTVVLGEQGLTEKISKLL